MTSFHGVECRPSSSTRIRLSCSTMRGTDLVSSKSLVPSIPFAICVFFATPA
jgi:hypothetical protein